MSTKKTKSKTKSKAQRNNLNKPVNTASSDMLSTIKKLRNGLNDTISEVQDTNDSLAAINELVDLGDSLENNLEDLYAQLEDYEEQLLNLIEENK